MPGRISIPCCPRTRPSAAMPLPPRIFTKSPSRSFSAKRRRPGCIGIVGSTHRPGAGMGGCSAVASMHQQPATAADQPAAPSATTVSRARCRRAQTASVGWDELDTEAAQRAALASLDEMTGRASHGKRTGGALRSGPVCLPGRLRRRAAGRSVSRTAAATGNAVVATDNADAGYAGREDIWASALDILAEGTSGSKGAPGGSVCGPSHASGSRTADAARAAAVAEGHRANEMHQHVNSLIEEELGQVPPRACRARAAYCT